MPTSYPGAFDALTNPITTDPLTAPSHAGQHTDANDAIEALQVRAGRTGTSFPGSPASGARFLRTDRNIEYFYDGTRWLSATLYTQPVVANPSSAEPLTTAGGVFGRVMAWTSDYDQWLEALHVSYYVATTNNGSNYWRFILEDQDAGTDIVIINTSAAAANTWTKAKSAISALLGTSKTGMQLSSDAVGSPGGIYWSAMVTYRLVG